MQRVQSVTPLTILAGEEKTGRYDKVKENTENNEAGDMKPPKGLEQDESQSVPSADLSHLLNGQSEEDIEADVRALAQDDDDIGRAKDLRLLKLTGRSFQGTWEDLLSLGKTNTRRQRMNP